MSKRSEGPSFAFRCKEEIAQRIFDVEDIRPFLSAFCRINGSFRISSGTDELDISCESAKLAKLIYDMMKRRYGYVGRFAYSRSMGFYRRTKYHVLLPHPEKIMEDLEIDLYEPQRPLDCVRTQQAIGAFLTGAFCASGSVNDPSSTNYHLEISMEDERQAKWLLHLFVRANGGQFHPKMIKRRNRSVIYLKRAEEISDFLILMGATECCLNFEDIRVSRDFANIGNRLSILDRANYAKSEKTGIKQLEYISSYLDRVGGIENVSNPKLALLIQLRQDNPDASMEEIARMMSEEFASTITKSNVNHLFRYLKQQYENEHGKTEHQ